MSPCPYLQRAGNSGVTEPRLSALKAVSLVESRFSPESSGDALVPRPSALNHFTFETRRVEKRLPARADGQMEDQKHSEQMHNEDPPLVGERSDDSDGQERRKISPVSEAEFYALAWEPRFIYLTAN